MADEISSNALERGFAILEAAAASRHGLTNSDISRRLDIPKSSASYLLRTLEKLGYLHRENSGKYRLGLKLLALTRNALADLDVREIAKPFLEKFVKQNNLPSHLAVLDNGRAVYVEKIEVQNSFVRMDIWVGHRVPVHSTAIGKALVLHLPEAEIERILDERGMEKKTLQTISTHTRFQRELEKVRRHGFAIDNEENSDGVRCVAAPIFDFNRQVIAAFGTSSTTTRLSEERLPEITAQIKNAAQEISRQIGFAG